ncbi:MAG: hypothetical protein ACRELX_14460 [Longimicrobiales bacterium]
MMTTTPRFHVPARLAFAAFGFVFLAGSAGAQLPSASTAALGLGDSYTAAARGFNAVAWNPAGLGLTGNQRASATMLTVRGSNGFGPVTLRDVADYSDVVVPASVKQDWLGRISTAGGQTGVGEASATWGAFQVGRFAMQFGTASRALTDLSPGVAELVMFGNAGVDGSVGDLDLSGSSLAAYAYSTAAASLAQPIAFPGGRLSLGVTVKWTAGHALALGENSVGSSTGEPLALQLDFPLVQTSLHPDSLKFDNGHGVGVDIGAGLELGRWTFAAAVQNVYNDFRWKADALRYRPLSLSFTAGATDTDTDARAFADAPEAVRSRMEQLGFEPVIAVGAMVRPSDRLMLTGDFRQASEDGMSTGPTMHAGGGLQYRLASWLPVRVGGALVSMGENDSGFQVGGGFGLDMGGWNLSASAARRATNRFGDATTVMLTIFGTGID